MGQDALDAAKENCKQLKKIYISTGKLQSQGNNSSFRLESGSGNNFTTRSCSEIVFA